MLAWFKKNGVRLKPTTAPMHAAAPPGRLLLVTTVLIILVATLVAGIGSVWLAAGLMRLGLLRASDGGAGGVGPQHLLSLAAGALLATAFMHLLPEAFESRVGAKALFAHVAGRAGVLLPAGQGGAVAPRA